MLPVINVLRLLMPTDKIHDNIHSAPRMCPYEWQASVDQFFTDDAKRT